MNLLNKILLGFVFIAILPFLVLAAMTLKTHQSWMPPVPKLEREIAAEVAQQATWENGDPNDPTRPGIRQLKVALHNDLIDRGGVWRNCAKSGVTPEGVLTVTVGDQDLGNPLASVQDNIKDKAIMFVFEGRDGGQYLGEFKVASVNQKLVTLSPALKLTEDEIQALNNSAGELILTDVMPIDRSDIFAGMDAAALQRFLPPEMIPEYLHHGQPKTDEDDPESVDEKGNFVRPLRDYSYFFHHYHHQFSVLSDTKLRAQADLKSVMDDKLHLDTQLKKSDEQIEELNKEFDRVKKERVVATAYLKAVEERLAEVQADVEKMLVANRKLAAEWTAVQTEAARRINEATAAAPAGAGRRP
jgi:hypothetical protein